MLPEKQGLYAPENEHDNCGAGFICSLQGKKTNNIIHKALDILDCLEHRGAVSADGKTGDGAGILIEIPHEYLKEECSFEIPEANEYAVGMVFLPEKESLREICILYLKSAPRFALCEFPDLEFPPPMKSPNKSSKTSEKADAKSPLDPPLVLKPPPIVPSNAA